ncbi:MAG: aminotransferase class I/II-fold pyridoxal phosphate-dependent enzyme [Clostridia bacterium]|nr:aminotransferase class I/II-fold pyridoxal phosphate-dependent enzyme [Clostridia bacterium]
MEFSKRMDQFGDEIFAAMNQRRVALESQGRTLYNLFVGTPDFPVSERVRKAFCNAAADPENWKYSLRDTPKMQQAVCDYYAVRYGVTITPDMICSCAGSQEGIGHIGLALCDEGDLVLLPTPCYPVFIAGAQMANAEIWYYELNEANGFLPDVDSIPADVAKRAKYMVVSLPSNPAGSVGTPECYRKIIAFAKQYDVLIVHDNAYSDIIFDGEAGGSFLAYPEAGEVGVEFFSLSKSFNLTGARISFCIGRPDVVAAFRRLRGQYDFGMFLPTQAAAIEALRTPRAETLAQCAAYQARRDALCDGLNAIGWPVRRSRGSMFVWAKIPDGWPDSMTFCMALMERAGVVCTPGGSFGPSGEGYVRFALVLPPERIREAVEAIRRSGILGEGAPRAEG